MIRYGRATAFGLLVGLATGAIWVGYAYHRDLVDARARVSTGSRLISTRCGPIEYAEVGAGPVILAVHGAGGGFDQGLALGAPFAAKGYRVIAMSRFGYLRTPAPTQPSIALQADAHACLLEALGVARAAVIGVSAGAPSALEFALRYPGRCSGLVLLMPGWYPDPGSSSRPRGALEALLFERSLQSDFLFWAVGKLLPALVERTVLGTPPAVVEAGSPSDKARIAAVLRGILPISRRQVGLLLERQLTVARLSRPLESMSVPTLAMSAEDDLYGTYPNAQYIARHVLHCRLVAYRTGGHLWVGHHDELLATTLEFLHEHS